MRPLSALRFPTTAALADSVRRLVIEQSWRANTGHIGSCLSIADLVAAVLAVMRGVGDDADRDRLVLAKGHAALALYAGLHAMDRLDRATLDTFVEDGSRLGVHPEHALEGIDFSTGSLGHGLSIGAGAALAARLDRSERRAFVVMSDAECNEGSVWEAAMFAAHHRLANLVVLLDHNRQQALGYTEDVLEPTPLARRWRSFGWEVDEVDGHDADGLAARLEELDVASGPPHLLLAHTTFGKGVSFMEGRIEWHYRPMSEEQYRQALAELAAAGS
ncbi:MAG: transketolase [Actinomycetota bacterium]|nr:transketolase [Actinomycetota bacterium]